MLSCGYVTGCGTSSCPYEISGWRFTKAKVPIPDKHEFKGSEGYAIEIKKSDDHWLIANNTFDGLHEGAILVYGAPQVTIAGNTFARIRETQGASDCLLIGSADYLEAYEEQEIHDPMMATAISAHDIDTLRIVGNEFLESPKALAAHLRRSRDVTLANNTFDGFQQGVCTFRLQDVHVSGNDFREMGAPGLALFMRDPLDHTASWSYQMESVRIEENHLEGSVFDVRANETRTANVQVLGNEVTGPANYRFQVRVYSSGDVQLAGNRWTDVALAVGGSRRDQVVVIAGDTFQNATLHGSLADYRDRWGTMNITRSQFRDSGIRAGVARLELDSNRFLEFRSSDAVVAEVYDARITRNLFINNTRAISFDHDHGRDKVVQHNSFSGHERVLNAGSDPFDGRYNWWGCPEGPGQPGCDGVPYLNSGSRSPLEAVTPWLTTPPL